MKIYEIGTGYTPIPAQVGAATEIVVEELTRSLRKMELDAEILDIASASRAATDLPIHEVPIPAAFTKDDVSLGLMHKLKRVVYSVALVGKLKKLLKQASERVILHFHNQYNLFFFLKMTPAKLRQKATVAYTVHSYIWHGSWTEIAETVERRYFQEICCLKNVDCVFVLNERTLENIVSHVGVSANKVFLVDNGVNTDTYAPLPLEEKTTVRERYGVADKRVFLQIGSVCDRKNQLGSLQCLLPLLKADAENVFCYAGGIISQEYQGELLRFAEENGVAEQVKYLGEITPGAELNEIYNLGVAMVFPSKLEGFSLVIIEAMSVGLPVFVGENLQFKLRDKCLIFRDGEEFLRLVKEQITEDPEYTDRAVARRQMIQQIYGWDAVATAYLEVFNRLGQEEYNG